MIQVDKLMETYKEFMSLPMEPVIDSEVVSLLFQTEWLRVLMVRRNGTPDRIVIDAEISFPVKMNSDFEKNLSDGFLRDLVLETIKHLKYLLVLADHGYRLGIIGESCLWTASKQFIQAPTTKDFEMLLAFQE